MAPSSKRQVLTIHNVFVDHEVSKKHTVYIMYKRNCHDCPKIHTLGPRVGSRCPPSAVYIYLAVNVNTRPLGIIRQLSGILFPRNASLGPDSAMLACLRGAVRAKASQIEKIGKI